MYVAGVSMGVYGSRNALGGQHAPNAGLNKLWLVVVMEVAQGGR